MPPATGTRMINAPQGLGGVNTIGVVVEGEDAEKGDVMDEPDQGAEEDRSDPGDARQR